MGGFERGVFMAKSDPTKDAEFNRVLKNLLSTPHKPHKPKGKKRKSPKRPKGERRS